MSSVSNGLTYERTVPTLCCWGQLEVSEQKNSDSVVLESDEKQKQEKVIYSFVVNRLTGKIYNNDTRAFIWIKCVLLTIGTPFAVIYRAVEPIYRLARIAYLYCDNKEMDSKEAKELFEEQGIEVGNVKALVKNAFGDLARGLTINLILGALMEAAVVFGAGTLFFSREVRVLYGDMEKIVNNGKTLRGVYLAVCFQPLANTNDPNWLNSASLRIELDIENSRTEPIRAS